MARGVALALLALALAVPAHAALREEPVTYRDGDTVMNGYIVYDDARTDRRPGILVVHEWWGITKHVRDSARELARMGYTAFALDMFGEGKTADNPKTAGELAGSVRKNPPVMHSRFNAAREVLVKHPSVDPKRIGAIGYCFGGSVVLDMARAGTDLAGVVSFHGNPTPSASPAAPGAVKARVLVLNGADDPLVKPDAIEAFKKEMESAKVQYRFVDYPGAVHAFTNPEATEIGKKFNMPVAYHPEADRQSKAEMAQFFSELFGKK
jgi:dienelactone hydrolase